MSESRLKKVNEKITEGVTDGYKKIEDGVVSGYKKMEKGVVDTYKKVEDKFVDKFLTHEGESVEDAKKRLLEEQAVREETHNIRKESLGISREIEKASIETNRNARKH